MKNLFKLKELANFLSRDMGCGDGEVFVSAVNLDDIFRVIKKRGIEDVEVNISEMQIIVMFILSNLNGENTNGKRLEMLREGKTDKYLGVNLHLQE